jgi:anti-sigma regulatory factor (Ser/Thr protein kinase)
LGQGRLSDIVRQYGMGTPGELIQAIRRAVEAWVDDEMRDDVAMVAVQVVPDTAVETSSRELVLPNEPSRIRDVRDFVQEFLADLRVPIEILSEVLLAASEAAGNAVKYGRIEEGRSEIRVRCLLEGTDVIVSVTDEGPGFELPGEDAERPDPLAAGGRGLYLMRALTDDVRIDSDASGTTVTLVRKAFDEPPMPVVPDLS